jgi:CubicO group peptidase (beta-lactamase class C family)
MNRLAKFVAAGAMLIALGASTAAPADPSATTLATGAPAPGLGKVDAGAATQRALTAEDAAAYFDGLIPDAINRADIAGAVVVVVKDGQPLLVRGYGFSDVKARRRVDADTTMFRPGSISKTFMWTAVMQQVEAGKIDLDADINQYLDFKIPAYDGKPITMRQLMTHSEGFSDAAKDLILTDPHSLGGLGATLKAAIPARIYEPGTTPAYSNYGASLAGYIVQRVSGERFEDYVQRHIFTPLGMTHSTFDQPLPKGWLANMSKGYRVASRPPGPYELISLSPAGALATSGSDMARFMIAHLQDGQYQGQRILAANTAELMHSPQFRPVPSLPAMALGFYQEPGNGHRVIGHAGDLNMFHSDMHLYLDDHVGLFVSFNSAGIAGATHNIRASLFKGFTDRYFPAQPVAEPPTWSTAVADGKTLSGQYLETRRSDSGWIRIATVLLGQSKISADKDGILTVSSFRGLNNQPKHWREIGPFQYQEVGGDSRAGAVVKDGKAVLVMTDDLPPVLALQPAPATLSAAWNLPLFYVTFIILTIAALTWPLAAIIRKRYGHSFALSGRTATLYRLTRADCVTWIIFAGLWFWFMSQKDIQWFSSGHDGIIRLIQLVGLVAVVGTLAPLAHAVTTVGDTSRSWWAKVSTVSIAAACVAAIWFVITLKLITVHIAY